MPSTRSTPSAASSSASSENQHEPEDEARIADARARSAAASGSRSNANEPARRAEPGEDRARVSAAAERGVDVGAVRSHRQRGNGFFEQDGDVFTVAHQRLKPSSSGGRSPAGNVIARAVSCCHFASSHSSNFAPWPTSTTR